MITLREFVCKVGKREHFRVYMPNRDCLAYESYFTHHSAIKITKKGLTLDFDDDYYDNNKYCDNVYKGIIDKDTENFLNCYGDYEVFSVECCGFRPTNMYKGKDGKLKIEETRDEARPYSEILNCFNLFIIPYDKEHTCGCDRCHHALIKDSKKTHRGYICVPDKKDIECKQCPQITKK